jgi:hypothetical protein
LDEASPFVLLTQIVRTNKKCHNINVARTAVLRQLDILNKASVHPLHSKYAKTQQLLTLPAQNVSLSKLF